ncbi:rhamnan synthesis F family protein [Flavonifractor sp. An100]|uniref:rhamnan synthesis F family protein n=1 Tax=Flavonifractor sp. An100 TaxID=1965538 RepID=UPI000B390F33|nr:rhamnan synthesis F family protein [Flavonifractor sp. An100]OUQ81550.1 rhamnan synthesis F [Flavonifractor sp. An100]
MKNRAAIYVFWEQHGIVRDYVRVYLEGLKNIASKVIVVANGGVNEEGKEILRKLKVELLERENIGVDFWAYKAAIDSLGQSIDQFDEVILTNCSSYGPIYPFDEMFSIMEKRQVDFWGITEWPLNANGYEGTWILSYFIVFTPKVFLSNDWDNYWANLPEVFSREECIEKHETKFTAYFANRGYTYDVYCPNNRDYIDLTIEAPDKLIMEMRCPILKRKAFCTEYIRFLSYHRGHASKKAFDYIKEKQLYNTDYILDDLLATQHYADIKNLLHLNYILPSNQLTTEVWGKKRIAIFFHVFYEDLLDINFHYLQSMPESADIYITSSRADLRVPVETRIKNLELKNARFELVEARGRADSAFLVHDSQYIDNYDYVCIAHDKKSSFLRPGCIGLDFGFHVLDSLLKSKEYVRNIIAEFEKNPRLGILEPVNLLHGNYMTLAGQEWGANYDKTVSFLRKAKVNVPIAAEVPPIAPMGAMFWFRPECLKKLLHMEWEYEDFPEEPMPLDGAIIHIVERAIPFFAQDAGYLVGWVIPSEDAEVYITDLYYLYRKNNILQHQPVVIPSTNEIIYVPQAIGVRGALKIYLKKKTPVSLWNFAKKIYYKLGGKGS